MNCFVTAMEASKAAVDPTDIPLSWRNYMNVKYDTEPFKTWDAWWKEALATVCISSFAAKAVLMLAMSVGRPVGTQYVLGYMWC